MNLTESFWKIWRPLAVFGLKGGLTHFYGFLGNGAFLGGGRNVQRNPKNVKIRKQKRTETYK